MPTERPDIVTDEHLQFLDDLRESGKTNMFGAIPYLERQFPELRRVQASVVWKYWANSFGERHPA